eukprot:SAG22_NODE_878_length_6715_cov_9.368652_13_plen_186_part_00
MVLLGRADRTTKLERPGGGGRGATLTGTDACELVCTHEIQNTHALLVSLPASCCRSSGYMYSGPCSTHAMGHGSTSFKAALASCPGALRLCIIHSCSGRSPTRSQPQRRGAPLSRKEMGVAVLAQLGLAAEAATLVVDTTLEEKGLLGKRPVDTGMDSSAVERATGVKLATFAEGLARLDAAGSL